jgi:uncharacterized protein (TIGR00369 family)
MQEQSEPSKSVVNTTDAAWGPRRTKQIGWHDPIAAAVNSRELSGRAFLQGIVDGRFPPPPIAELFDTTLVSVGEGEAVFSARPDESVYNPIGTVHGGWLCTLLDSAAGCAVHSLLPAGVGYSSIEIKVSFLKAVRADRGPVEATGRVLQLGRRVAFAEAHARNAAGDLVGHATTSLAVVSPAPTRNGA